jgi:hypothetical protein
LQGEDLIKLLEAVYAAGVAAIAAAIGGEP